MLVKLCKETVGVTIGNRQLGDLCIGVSTCELIRGFAAVRLPLCNPDKDRVGVERQTKVIGSCFNRSLITTSWVHVVLNNHILVNLEVFTVMRLKTLELLVLANKGTTWDDKRCANVVTKPGWCVDVHFNVLITAQVHIALSINIIKVVIIQPVPVTCGH